MFSNAARRFDTTRSSYEDARLARGRQVWHRARHEPDETTGSTMPPAPFVRHWLRAWPLHNDIVQSRSVRTATLKTLQRALASRELHRGRWRARRPTKASRRALAVSLAPRRPGYRGARR